MHRTFMLIALASMAIIIGACSNRPFHHVPMPDPDSYMVPFPELDEDGDDGISRDEFERRFPDADPDVFNEVDRNGDGAIDRDEWHDFREAHGDRS